MSGGATTLPPVRGLIRHRFFVAGTAVDLVLDAAFTGPGASAAAARLAEELIAETQGLPVAAVRVAGLMPSGRPVAVVVDGRRPPAVSLAHIPGLIGAAVTSRGAVGLDLVDLRDARPPLDCFLTATELALQTGDPAVLRARLWSAKEAAFKAAGVDEPFQPRRTLVTSCSADRFTWRLTPPAGSVGGAGRWFRVGRRIVAVAAAGGNPEPNFSSRAMS